MTNKICLIGDTHFGYGDSIFLESQLNFFKNQLIPYCKENGIKIWIQTGDFFDSRKNLDIYVQNKIFDFIENDLKDFQIYIYLGNHCTYHRNTNEINSLRLLKNFPNIKVIEQNEIITIHKRNFLFVPWIVNLKDFENYINENDLTNVDVCMGHFDLIGGQMGKNSFSKTGLTVELLSKFPKVFSGHYHQKSIMKNGETEIIYVGSPYHLNFSDESQSRGFHILDCNNLSYEFIENGVSPKFIYLEYPEIFDEKKIKNNFISVFVNDEINSDLISEYIESINKLKPKKEPILRVVENFSKVDINSIHNVKSLKELFYEFIRHLNLDEETKPEVMQELENLYSECNRDGQ